MARAPRPLRADAARNRGRILAAARERITEQGPEVGMDAIAAAAGVAVGTLYRHYPTKRDLVAAVLAGFVAEVASDAEASWSRVEDGARARDELVGFLGRVIEAAATNHAVKAAARGLGADDGDPVAEARASDALARIIAAGQSAGAIRLGVSVQDIYLLVATAPTDQERSSRDRWLDLVVTGLTIGGDVAPGPGDPAALP